MSNSKSDSKTIVPDFSKLDEFLEKDIRMDILLLLRLYKDKELGLNVTEISNLLNRNKATVGRHLKSLQKKGFLISKEEPSKRTINPKYYRIRDELMAFMEYEDDIGDLSRMSPKRKKRKFKRHYLIAEVIFKLFSHSMTLIEPFIEYLGRKLKEKELNTELLSRYLIKDKHLSLYHYPISEDVLEKFYQLHNKFRDDLEKLSKEGNNESNLIFIDALLPLKKMLKQRTNEE